MTMPPVRRIAAGVIVLAAAALAATVLVDNSDELASAGDLLTHLAWAWVVVALVMEVASYATRGVGQSLLLRAAPAVVPDDLARPGSVVLGAGTLAGDAAAYCLPFGFAASGVVMFKVLRRRHVDPTVAGWMFGLSTLLYLGAIAILTVGAVEIAGDADPVPGLQEAALILLVALVAVGLVYLVVRRGPLAGWAARTGRRRRAREVREIPTTTPDVPGSSSGASSSGASSGAVSAGGPLARLRRRVAEHATMLRTIRVPPGLLAASFGMMLLSWVTDIAVLGLAYAAVGATPPWLGLLLAYCAGQVAAAMPVTPGGLGVVEGSLTLALVAFGGAEDTSLAAVLLYRLIAYWLCIPAGALAWFALRAVRVPEREPVPEAALR